MKTCSMGHILKNQCDSKDIINNCCCLIREVYSIFIKCSRKHILDIKYLQGRFIFLASSKKSVNGLALAAS